MKDKKQKVSEDNDSFPYFTSPKKRRGCAGALVSMSLILSIAVIFLILKGRRVREDFIGWYADFVVSSMKIEDEEERAEFRSKLEILMSRRMSQEILDRQFDEFWIKYDQAMEDKEISKEETEELIAALDSLVHGPASGREAEHTDDFIRERD